MEMTQNQVYGLESEEKIEMTQNQLYGLRREDREMKTAVRDEQDLTPMYEVIDDMPNTGDLSYEYVS